ncbi:MAG: DUF1223 domain-containing protein [Brevundimonas sp.]|uniref:DUF1223 domain-containing protein n=1 Tax=Brevundimonas sp. TaxID=1871086 RepID=UPI001210C37A|nr:DUF1223 domain-containing protein [Brevundimonas sp.]RZJ17447.1 MAG: DUF1223 domain-containing protein [Brevundimonas sp.]
MSTRGWILSASAFIGLLALGASAGAETSAARHVRRAPPPAEPVVVELFTAQGCSGCPEANAMVETVAAETGVIALTYPVDYWDYLGWQDTFARPEFTARQRAYRQALKLRAVSTPQVIVDGHRQLTGARAPELEVVIAEETSRRGWPPEIEFRESGDRVGIGSGRPPRGGAEVVMVTYQRGPQTVTVGSGDNRGQAVRHVNVVRDIKTLGDWTGRPLLLALPQAREPADGIVVMIQSKLDRRILNAATLAQPEDQTP